MMSDTPVQNPYLVEITKIEREKVFLSRDLGRAKKRIEALENFKPTAEHINALPEPLRAYIHDLETRCDPSGDVRRLTLLKQRTQQLREQVESTYEKGFIDGLKCFAHWKDGEQHVGTTGTTLKEAIQSAREGTLWNYYPPEHAERAEDGAP